MKRRTPTAINNAPTDHVTAVVTAEVVAVLGLKRPADERVVSLCPQYHKPAAKICCDPCMTQARYTQDVTGAPPEISTVNE